MNKSNYYTLLLKPEADRLDENFNSPKYDKIYELLKKSKFKTIVPLGSQENSILKNITSGRTPKDIDYIDEGVYFLGASNIKFYEINFQSAPKISFEDHENKLRNSQIEEGNLLISMAGIIGRCAVYKKEQECNCNQAIAVLNLDKEKIIPEYLMYYLNSEIGQLFFGKLQHQSDQPNINLDEIKQILVITPEISKQKSIIKKCEIYQIKIFQKISELNELIKNLDMPIRDLLNKNPRDCNFLSNSNYYALSTLNLEGVRERIDFVANHPKFDWVRKFREWGKTIPLGSIISQDRFSYGISKSALESGDTGFLNVQHLNFDGRINFEPLTYLSNCQEEKKLLKDDILIARTGNTLGKSALITEEYEGFTFGSFCIRFSLNTKNYFPDFIAQFINSIYGQAQIMMLKAGSGKYNINLEHISDIRIPLVDKDTQKEILRKYHDSLKKLILLEKEIEELNNKVNEEFSKEIFE